EEVSKNDTEAVENYRKAIDHKAPKQLQAYVRLATLLRDQLNQPKEADEAINAMVNSAPQQAEVYGARGHYVLSDRRDPAQQKSRLEAARADFKKALDLSPDDPQVYIDLARISMVEGAGGSRDAEKIIERALKKMPDKAVLYRFLASLRLDSG